MNTLQINKIIRHSKYIYKLLLLCSLKINELVQFSQADDFCFSIQFLLKNTSAWVKYSYSISLKLSCIHAIDNRVFTARSWLLGIIVRSCAYILTIFLLEKCLWGRVSSAFCFSSLLWGPHQWLSDSALKTAMQHSIPERACSPNRSEFIVVFSETCVITD